MYKLIVFLIAILLLTHVEPAAAQAFGKDQVGTIPSAGLSANFKRGSRFTVTDAGTILGICAYLDGNGGVSGTQTVRFVLYADSNGVPGQKIEETASLPLNSGTVAAWRCGGLAYHPGTGGQSYWLVIHSGPTAGIVRDFYDGPNNWYGNADTFSDGASAPFGAGGAGSGTISIYAAFTFSSQLSHAGRTDVAGTTSSGLSANYKRASAFTLNGSGRLSSLSIYIDGNGGANGSQDVRAVLYGDSNGVPGPLIAESATIQGSKGLTPQWFRLTAPPVYITSGRYWIGIHTGTTAGVLRDYGDGAPNFYANADTFADGASPSFGAGSTGTVTLSAFASYNPGTYITKSFGRTSIAATPSSGLTANFKRGSKFPSPEQDAVVTGFYAYLDGMGGAPGVQQLRMAVYNATQDGSPQSKFAESQVVSIQSGAQPGWVYFPMAQPVRIESFYGFWIVIQSGDTGGIARDYGDGAANWAGNADAFVDGASSVFGTATPGTGTLSVYATYTTRSP